MKLGVDETIVIKFAVFEDNNGALAIENYVKINPCTTHIGVKYRFFEHPCVKCSGITLVKVDTFLKEADIFTKEMAPEKVVTMRKLVCKW